MSLDFRKTYKVAIDDGLGTMTGYAIRTETERVGKNGKWERLRYYDFEREHIFLGKTKKQLKGGAVFKTEELGWTITFSELTYDDFNEEIRPRLPAEVSEMINDLDDVYVWCRQQAGIN